MASTTVNFNLKTAGYVNYANQTLTFRLLTAGAEASTGDQTYVTLPGVVTATSSSNGDGSVSLFRNGKSGIESVYEVILPNREKAKFIIPSGSATIELATLLVDHVPGGSDTQQSSVYAEAIKRANHTGQVTLATAISDAATFQLKPSEGAFVNGDKTKLDAIEPSADVTDTANVRGADALMDDELTDLSGVKGVTISTLQVKPSEGAFVNGDKTKLDTISTLQVKPSEGAFVDGDKTKLVGIETGATTDQTASEIRALVESALNSNVFTDLEKSKLGTVDNNADETVTANVTSAGAVMTSTLTSPTNVKALDQSVIAGASPNFTNTNITEVSNKNFMTDDQQTKINSITASALQLKPSEGPFEDGDKTKLDNIAGTSVQEVQDIAGQLATAATGTQTGISVTYDAINHDMDFIVTFPAQTANDFTNTLKTKLDNIADGADVTNATSVSTAGALMTNTLVSLANVRGLDQPVSSGASPNLTATNITEVSDKNFMTDAQKLKLDSISGVTASVSNFVPRSITFPTASDFLSVVDSTSNGKMDVSTGDFSLSFWARLDADTGTQPVIQKNGSAGYALSFVNGVLTLTLTSSGTSTFALTAASAPLNDSQWHVYVVTVDRDGNATAYVDNVAQTATAKDVSFKGGDLNNTSDFLIGLVGNNKGDEIALGNYVVLHKDILTADEISQIYFSADAALIVGNPLPSLMVDLRQADKAFTDVSSTPLPVVTNGTVTFNESRINSLNGVAIGTTTPSIIIGTTVAASSGFLGAINGTVGATTPAAVTGTNVLATTGIGYNNGGVVDQLTSKETQVTLDKPTGQINMSSSSMDSGASKSFKLNNSTISAYDILVINHISGGTIGGYAFNSSTANGEATISIRNNTASTEALGLVISFVVIKSAIS